MKNRKQLRGTPVLLMFIIGMFLLGFTWRVEWPVKNNEEKLEKEASDIWHNTEVKLEKVETSPFGSTDNHQTLFRLLGNNQKLGYGYIGRVKTCRPGGCSRPAGFSSGGDAFEYFDYLLIFTENIEVKQVKILNYQASRGYEVTNKRWLDQFSGYSGENNLQYGKNIQAISGATVSANSMVNDIKKVLEQLKKMKKQNKI